MSSKRFAILAAVVHEIQAGRDDVARRVLARFVDEFLGEGAPHEELQHAIFASALSRRLESDRTEEINLYLRRFGQSQISLFNLVARHLPTVALAGRVANEVLAGLLAEKEEAAIVDVGIGTGRQEAALVRLLGERGQLPKRLRIIAIEPDATSLCAAEAAISQAASEFGSEIVFHPIAAVVEELDAVDWAAIRRRVGGVPAVALAAFAAHHIRAKAGTDTRADLFTRLRETGVEAVVLCEPSSEHNVAHLPDRFRNCWNHFGLTFRLIDELGIDPGENAAMKMFFAREIEDIVANAEATRCERHEPVETWMGRLRDAGFAPHADFAGVDTAGHGGVRIVPRTGYVGLDYRDETLVAILCATAPVPARIGPERTEALQATV